MKERPLEDRRGKWKKYGTACDVWDDCCKTLGHYGPCQRPGEAVDNGGSLPECRIVDHWKNKVAA